MISNVDETFIGEITDKVIPSKDDTEAEKEGTFFLRELANYARVLTINADNTTRVDLPQSWYHYNLENINGDITIDDLIQSERYQEIQRGENLPDVIVYNFQTVGGNDIHPKIDALRHITSLDVPVVLMGFTFLPEFSRDALYSALKRKNITEPAYTFTSSRAEDFLSKFARAIVKKKIDRTHDKETLLDMFSDNGVFCEVYGPQQIHHDLLVVEPDLELAKDLAEKLRGHLLTCGIEKKVIVMKNETELFAKLAEGPHDVYLSKSYRPTGLADHIRQTYLTDRSQGRIYTEQAIKKIFETKRAMGSLDYHHRYTIERLTTRRHMEDVKLLEHEIHQDELLGLRASDDEMEKRYWQHKDKTKVHIVYDGGVPVGYMSQISINRGKFLEYFKKERSPIIGIEKMINQGVLDDPDSILLISIAVKEAYWHSNLRKEEKEEGQQIPAYMLTHRLVRSTRDIPWSEQDETNYAITIAETSQSIQFFKHLGLEIERRKVVATPHNKAGEYFTRMSIDISTRSQRRAYNETSSKTVEISR